MVAQYFHALREASLRGLKDRTQDSCDANIPSSGESVDANGEGLYNMSNRSGRTQAELSTTFILVRSRNVLKASLHVNVSTQNQQRLSGHIRLD